MNDLTVNVASAIVSIPVVSMCLFVIIMALGSKKPFELYSLPFVNMLISSLSWAIYFKGTGQHSLMISFGIQTIVSAIAVTIILSKSLPTKKLNWGFIMVGRGIELLAAIISLTGHPLFFSITVIWGLLMNTGQKAWKFRTTDTNSAGVSFLGSAIAFVYSIAFLIAGQMNPLIIVVSTFTAIFSLITILRIWEGSKFIPKILILKSDKDDKSINLVKVGNQLN